eukprot:5554822-Pyramimonas_sp.AAC.1
MGPSCTCRLGTRVLGDTPASRQKKAHGSGRDWGKGAAKLLPSVHEEHHRSGRGRTEEHRAPSEPDMLIVSAS